MRFSCSYFCFGGSFHSDIFLFPYQSDNSAMWLHGGAGSRTISAVPPGNFYGFQGQSQHGGFRQAHHPSQYGFIFFLVTFLVPVM
jgi:hypothetical protein